MVVRPLEGSFDASEDDVHRGHFGHYLIGVAVGLLLAALVVGFWYLTRPPESTLQWGDEVYTSETQFKEYLDANGLRYSTWVNRHPGADPWGSP